MKKLQERAEKKSAKRRQKKDQIAASALAALGELGYANTALRDIAASSGLSLSMLHYYFDDKIELMIYCVRVYKDDFVHTLKTVLTAARGQGDAIAVFASGLTDTVVDHWQMHRLWYDIRSQAMFEEVFQPVVSEIESRLIELVQLALGNARTVLSIPIIYAMLDGVFRYYTQKFAAGERPDRQEIEDAFRGTMTNMLTV